MDSEGRATVYIYIVYNNVKNPYYVLLTKDVER